jgi:superkiller protein 3
MRAVFSILAFAAFLSPAATWSQDLGSANQLFGKPKKEAAAPAKRPPARTATPRRTPPAAAKRTTTTTRNTAARREATSPTKAAQAPSAADLLAFETLLSEGNSARDERKYAAAESAYSQARELNPRDPRAAFGLGNLYADQHLWEQAEDNYRVVLQLGPDDPWVHIALSYVLSQPVFLADLSGRYAEAERLARKASELAPDNALAFDQVGVTMELRGLIGAETEAAYRRSIQLDPNFAPAYAHLGRLFRRRGMAAEAQNYYNIAIQKATEVGTMVLVAEVLQSEQRFRDSEGLLRQAIARDPSNPSGLILLGRALATMENYTEAESFLRKSLEVSANGLRSNLLLSSLYLRQGKTELAENASLQALRFVNTLERANLAQQFEAVGEAYEKAGKLAEAERCFRQAVSLDAARPVAAAKLAELGKSR